MQHVSNLRVKIFSDTRWKLDYVIFMILLWTFTDETPIGSIAGVALSKDSELANNILK